MIVNLWMWDTLGLGLHEIGAIYSKQTLESNWIRGL